MKNSDNDSASLFLLIAIILQIINIYYTEYQTFEYYSLAHEYGNKVIIYIKNETFFMNNKLIPKLIVLIPILLIIFASKPQKLFKVKYVHVISLFSFGLIFFLNPFFSGLLNILLNCLGFIALIVGGVLFNSVIPLGDNQDIFNKENESFPQFEKQHLDDEQIVNLQGTYWYKGKYRTVYINLVNIFRATIIFGTPGSGKTFAILLQFMQQLLAKGFCMYVYDYKYPTLAKTVILYKQKYATNKKLKTHIISFDDLANSSRCNPLHCSLLESQLDAVQASQAIFYNQNRTWIQKQGDFFVESPINYVASIIWWLRNYQGGIYCTFPHLLEMATFSAQEVIPILQASGHVDNLIAPFAGPLKMGAYEQLAGQISSAILSLSRLADPAVYWVTSGNDFSLNITDPENPVLLIMGNNPDRQEIYSAALGLYHSKLVKSINKQNKLKCGFIMDELPTVFIKGLDNLIATARSNKIAIALGIQDLTQYKRDYGDKEAMAIYATVGNIFSGQTLGETASMLSKRFGRNVQTKQNISFGENNSPNFSLNESLDFIIPEDTISNLSTGHFVGSIADDIKYPIDLKIFNCKINVPPQTIKDEEEAKSMLFNNLQNRDLKILEKAVAHNYLDIKKEVKLFVNDELERIYDSPQKKLLVDGFGYDFLE
jgi:Type IV secretory system Conjugative DNA transfer/YWFCY protein